MKSNKKILLAFDSEKEQNIGCKVTSRGIKIFLKGLSNNITSIDASEFFKIKRRLDRRLDIKVLGNIKLRYSRMLLFYLIMKQIPKKIIHEIQRSDIVVINGEGTIHDNRVTGLLLLTAGTLAKKLGKKVILLNTTVENMAPYFLEKIGSFDLITVREPMSFNYVKKSINKKRLIELYDFAWIYLIDKHKKYMLKHKPKTNKILFTRGVLLNTLKTFTNYDHLMVDRKDMRYQQYFKNNFYLYHIIKKDIANIFNFLNNYSLLISGRHHLNIIAMFFGMPLQILESNTWKIEGTILSVSNLHYKTKKKILSRKYADFLNEKDTKSIARSFEILEKRINDFDLSP